MPALTYCPHELPAGTCTWCRPQAAPAPPAPRPRRRCRPAVPSPAQLDRLVAQALAEVETGVADARGDHPTVHEDDLYHEVAASVAAMHPPAVAAEVRRRLGF